jgi:hypothetical protein
MYPAPGAPSFGSGTRSGGSNAEPIFVPVHNSAATSASGLSRASRPASWPR